MIVSKNVIARELLPRAAHLKLVGLEISQQGWAVAIAHGDDSHSTACGTGHGDSRKSRPGRKPTAWTFLDHVLLDSSLRIMGTYVL